MFTITTNNIKDIIDEKAKGGDIDLIRNRLTDELRGHISRNRLARLLNNVKNPNANELFIIAGVLNCAVEDVVNVVSIDPLYPSESNTNG